jgi:hypothetical protein
MHWSGMTRRDNLGLIGLAFAAFAAVALLLSIPINVVSHAPFIQTVSTETGELSDAHGHGHDHGHDDDRGGGDADSPEGQGHTHGHNPSDHSHDPPQHGSQRPLLRHETTSVSVRTLLMRVPPMPVFKLERPPKA